MLTNTIIYDFDEEGLCIDISTKLTPTRKIMIDRDVYYNNDGKISARGERAMMVVPNQDNKYLARFIMGVEDRNIKVIHSDKLLVDYRRSNLIVTEKYDLSPNRLYHNTLHDFKRSYCKKLLDSGEVIEIIEDEKEVEDPWY